MKTAGVRRACAIALTRLVVAMVRLSRILRLWVELHRAAIDSPARLMTPSALPTHPSTLRPRSQDPSEHVAPSWRLAHDRDFG
jgi:hypothetical protein